MGCIKGYNETCLLYTSMVVITTFAIVVITSQSTQMNVVTIFHATQTTLEIQVQATHTTFEIHVHALQNQPATQFHGLYQ